MCGPLLKSVYIHLYTILHRAASFGILKAHTHTRTRAMRLRVSFRRGRRSLYGKFGQSSEGIGFNFIGLTSGDLCAAHSILPNFICFAGKLALIGHPCHVDHGHDPHVWKKAATSTLLSRLCSVPLPPVSNGPPLAVPIWTPWRLRSVRSEESPSSRPPKCLNRRKERASGRNQATPILAQKSIADLF